VIAETMTAVVGKRRRGRDAVEGRRKKEAQLRKIDSQTVNLQYVRYLTVLIFKCRLPGDLG